MKCLWLLAVCLTALGTPSGATPTPGAVSESTPTVESPAIPTTPTSEGAEEREQDIIPRDIYSSTSSLSATMQMTPYEQAKDELIRAINLWNAGHAEAASDMALEAYDDLVDLRRVPGVKRSKIRAQIHQAATVYVEAGIAYIRSYVKKNGSTHDAIQEGRARLEDLRDVAMGYVELNRMLNKAIEHLPASSAVRPKSKKP